MRIILFLTLLWVLPTKLIRAEGPDKPELLYLQKPKPKGDFRKLVIPIKRANNLILVEARIDGKLGFFILDTGAPYLVLNRTYFRDYPVENRASASGTDGRAFVQQSTTVEKLEIRDLYYEFIEADLADLSDIENKRGVKIFGLLGINLFLEMEMKINLSNSTVTLYELDKEGSRLAGNSTTEEDSTATELAFELRNDVMLLPSVVRNEALTICFDTGAETAVLDNDLSEKVFSAVKITNRKELVGAGGGGVEVLFGYIKNLNVGFLLPFAQVIIADLESIGRSYGFPLDGIIGYDLLKQGTVDINFKKQTIQIEKA